MWGGGNCHIKDLGILASFLCPTQGCTVNRRGHQTAEKMVRSPPQSFCDLLPPPIDKVTEIIGPILRDRHLRELMFLGISVLLLSVNFWKVQPPAAYYFAYNFVFTCNGFFLPLVLKLHKGYPSPKRIAIFVYVSRGTRVCLKTGVLLCSSLTS